MLSVTLGDIVKEARSPIRICRFIRKDDAASASRVGVVHDGVVRDVTVVAHALPAQSWPLLAGDAFIANLKHLLPQMAQYATGAEGIPLDDILLLSPVANPSRIICAVGNFPEQVAEKGLRPTDQGLLFKAGPPTGAGEGLALAFPGHDTFHEIELVAVIGKPGRNLGPGDAAAAVAGYAIGLDMTLAGPEYPSLRKSIDGYGVVGPWIVTADEIPDPAELRLSLSVNGVRRQSDTVGRLVLSVPELVAFASRYMTLQPGDLIFTGNPGGSAPVRPGDIVTAEISDIGQMSVLVTA